MEVQRAAANANLMTKCITQLEAERINVENDLDALDQYSRRNRVTVHGVPACDDPENAVIKLFSETLGVPIERAAIDRCHRLGAASMNDNKPRAIIVTFQSYKVRQKIFNAKRCLKGTKIVITGSLTKLRSELLHKAKSARSVKATWTSDGRIICLLTNGKKVSITTKHQLSG